MPTHTCSRLQRLEVQLQVTSTLLQRRALLKSSTVIFLLLACLMNWELLCECPPERQLVIKGNRGYCNTSARPTQSAFTHLRRLPEPIAHVLGQQRRYVVAELHTCALRHQPHRLPGHLSEAALLPVRHAHRGHSRTGNRNGFSTSFSSRPERRPSCAEFGASSGIKPLLRRDPARQQGGAARTPPTESRAPLCVVSSS